MTVNRAIVVDDRMQAVDDPHIFVVGECAEHRGKVYGLVAPLWEQGQVIAEHLTGQKPESSPSSNFAPNSCARGGKATRAASALFGRV